jgi:hypothetical protein
VSCSECSGDARFKGYRDCRIQTLLGKAVYERAYYHCDHCGHGWFPTDEEFGLEDKRSAGAREVITLVGVLQAFDEGSRDVLPRLTGLNVSAKTVERVTEAVGEDIAGRRAAGETIGPESSWKWNADAEGRRVAYVSLDATGVPQQGPHGEKAEAKMPWVGAVFNPQPTHEERRRRVGDRRYVSGLMPLEEIGGQLRRECRGVGVSRADMVIGLTDGGNGLENCLLTAVGGLARDIEFILDFYHASDAVREFAKTLFPHEETRRREQTEAWCHTLKHQGGEALLAELTALDVGGQPDAVQEAHRLLTGYVRKNLHRMDYPTYVGKGWQIGSGMIESACKTVVGQRLKESGMRWRERGTASMTHARALYKSEPILWDAYWQHTAA